MPSLLYLKLSPEGTQLRGSTAVDLNVCGCLQDLLKLAKELIGKPIYVGWPYLTEAMVHSISDGAVQYYQVSEGSRIYAKKYMYLYVYIVVLKYL